MTLQKWPVIEDLPEEERGPFSEWLRGRAVPINRDGTMGYYPWDYIIWKPKPSGQADRELEDIKRRLAELETERHLLNCKGMELTSKLYREDI